MSKESMHPIAFLSVVLVLLCGCFELGFCKDDPFIMMKTLGGSQGSENSVEIESLGRFAVEEHNKNENALLEFAKVVNAEEQVVAGKLYHLTLEAIDAGKKKIYEAKVWVKPWMNFKQLQEFKYKYSPIFTSADLGLRRDSCGSEWSVVPTVDPTVKDAAAHAVKTIQNMSNSLFPYQLLDILKAKSKVIKDSTKFALLLKVRRGSKDEKFKVIVNKNHGGMFYLNEMEQDHS